MQCNGNPHEDDNDDNEFEDIMDLKMIIICPYMMSWWDEEFPGTDDSLSSYFDRDRHFHPMNPTV